MSETKVRPWTTDEDKFLEENYLVKGTIFCAVELGRTGAAVRARCRRLGIRQRHKALQFSSEEDDYIRLHYGSRRASDLAIYLARTESSIRQRARVLGAATSRW